MSEISNSSESDYKELEENTCKLCYRLNLTDMLYMKCERCKRVACPNCIRQCHGITCFEPLCLDCYRKNKMCKECELIIKII